MPPKAAKQRGRSTSAETRTRGRLSRSDIQAFANLLTPEAKFRIDWRIVNPDLAHDAAATAAVPWATWTGTAKVRDDEGWTVEYVDEAQAPAGQFNLPPPEVEGGYVEIRALAKIEELPTLRSLAKRPREEQQTTANPPKTEDLLQKLTESITGNALVERTTICQGLRLEEGDDTHKCFNACHWLLLAAAAGERKIIADAWQSAIGKFVADQGMLSRARPREMQAYIEAREQFYRLLSTLSLPTDKHEWKLPMFMMFTLIGATISLTNNKGREVYEQLRDDYNKASAIINVSARIQKVFSRGRRQWGTLPNSDPHQNSIDKIKPSPIPIPGAVQCKKCKKYHPGPPGKYGAAFWRNHLCE